MLHVDFVKSASNGVSLLSGEGKVWPEAPAALRVGGVIDPLKTVPSLVWSPLKLWLLYVACMWAYVGVSPNLEW